MTGQVKALHKVLENKTFHTSLFRKIAKGAQEATCSLIACKMQNIDLERKESYTEITWIIKTTWNFSQKPTTIYKFYDP